MSIAIIIVGNNVSNPKQKKKSIILTVILTIISEIIAATVPVIFPFKGDSSIQISTQESTTSESSTGEPTTGQPTTQSSLNQYRYNLYDDNEIIKRIEAINSDLSGKGKHIKPDILKEFIYVINGDYSLCESSDVIFDVTNILINVDNDLVNIMCNSLDSYDILE